MVAPIVAFNASFALCLAVLGTAAAGYGWRSARLWRALPWLWALAGLALTAGLALLWREAGRPPMSNQYESLLVLLWFVFPLALVFHRSSGRRDLLPAAALAACLLFGAANLLDRTVRPLMPALRSNWLMVHVLSCMAAYAAFALAAAGAGWVLIRKTSGEAEESLLRPVKLGFACLTLGIVTGSVWANTAWGAWWSWDPKETWSLLTWLAYAALLHARKRGLRGARFSVALLVGFGLVLFTYFGVNFLLKGLHSYA